MLAVCCHTTNHWTACQKSEDGIFNMRSGVHACCAHEGKADTDGSARVVDLEEAKDRPSPYCPWSPTHVQSSAFASKSRTPASAALKNQFLLHCFKEKRSFLWAVRNPEDEKMMR